MMLKVRYFVVLLLLLLVVLALPACNDEDSYVEDPFELYTKYDPWDESMDYFYYWPFESFGNKKIEDPYIDSIQISIREPVYKTDVDKIYIDEFFPGNPPQKTASFYGDAYGVVAARPLGIEKYEEGQWVPIKLKKESSHYTHLYLHEDAWRDYPLMSIPEEGATSFGFFETRNLYKPLEEGHYRLIKFYGNGTCKYAEFDVVE